MCSAEPLRQFIRERLTAAAEEIFTQLEKTIVQYEEELDRQRRLLDLTWRPRTEQNPAEELLNDVGQEEPEPLEFKEEREELCAGHHGDQIGFSQQTDQSFMVTPEEEPDRYQDPAEVQKQEGSDSEDSGSGSFPQSLGTRQTETPPGEKHHRCQTCGKSFSDKNTLKFHLRIHSGEKPFLCHTCGKGFTEKMQLTRHIRTHTGEKPYECQTCGKSFRVKDSLNTHARTHTGERPFVCQTCGKGFIDKSTLRLHLRIHTGEKPFSCLTCGRRFRVKSSLTCHMRTHTGEKPFSCPTCGKSFCVKGSLTTHMRVHSGHRSFLCEN
ncbi:uncharacterized protein FYW61_004151 [Anableps anableps]